MTTMVRQHSQLGPLLVRAVSTKISDSPAGVEANRNINNSKDLEELIWLLPAGLSTAAFFSYDFTRTVFHDFIDAASGHAWTAADGGK
jgi:hypothetical protein